LSTDRPSRNEIFSSDDMMPTRDAADVMKDDFGWEVPVETIPVPSMGKLYPKGSSLHGIQTIDIRAMTAREEDILTSRALLKKGTVISRLLESCIVNKSLDASDMVLGDRNALMIAIRVTGYGPEYKTDVTCPKCRTTQAYEFDLGNLRINTLDINPVALGENRFEFSLPVTKKKVEFRFLTGADEESLSTEAEKMRQLMPDAEVDNMVTRRLERSIISVGGVTDRVKIASFVRNMPALDSRRLRQYMRSNEPGIDMKTVMTCASCSESSSLTLPLGAGFFWPRD
jgi:hypothetical protein